MKYGKLFTISIICIFLTEKQRKESKTAVSKKVPTYSTSKESWNKIQRNHAFNIHPLMDPVEVHVALMD